MSGTWSFVLCISLLQIEIIECQLSDVRLGIFLFHFAFDSGKYQNQAPSIIV